MTVVNHLIFVSQFMAKCTGIIVHGTKPQCLLISQSNVDPGNSPMVTWIIRELLVQLLCCKGEVGSTKDFILIFLEPSLVKLSYAANSFRENKQRLITSQRLIFYICCKLSQKVLVHRPNLPLLWWYYQFLNVDKMRIIWNLKKIEQCCSIWLIE